MSAPCQTPAPLAGNDIGALVLKQIETARALSECAIRHAGAVNAYGAARRAIAEWNAGAADD